MPGVLRMETKVNMKLADRELVACEVCLKEIPMSEASNCEASDYVIHFCGLECYERWRKQDTSNDSEIS
jgi:hypothetical protein